MTIDRDFEADADHLRVEILEHTRRSLTSLAEQTVAFEGGTAFRTRSLPLVWTLNQVRVHGPATAEEILAMADRHQFDLPYRHVVVQGDELGTQLVEELGAAGWSFECEVLMAMTHHVERLIDTSRVVELSEGQMLALMRDWLTEELEDITDDGLAQVLEYNRREGALVDELRLGIVEDGVPLALTKLRPERDIAWVEDVYTAPIARGSGHARSLLEAALRQAWDSNPRFVYIVADDDDWPKEFYARAGFVAVGTNATFHRARP